MRFRYKFGLWGGVVVSFILGLNFLMSQSYKFQKESRNNLAKLYEKERAEKAKTSKLVEQATSLSMGEDRIWSITERREFLDDLGFKAPIQEGQVLYFEPRPTRAQGEFYSHVRLTRGQHDDYVGIITRTELRVYIAKQQKAKLMSSK